ncbi:MAG: methyltransferase domain-containing protein [Candidatus Omnitrophica bacterium]|nr:methyltransferase domain-containing protein [Candidatus Omnitrophota bacterium]
MISIHKALPVKILKSFVKKARSIVEADFLAYPKKVQCNVCGWSGRRFLSDPWHKYVNCPVCHTSVRQRLFIAAIQNTGNIPFENTVRDKRILHFAPEDAISGILKNISSNYSTADLLRNDCDYKIDISNMPEIKEGTFDTVIAFDVLEHVADYKKAIEEVRRILSPDGYGIFTVPQKDNTELTFEDPTIITPEDRIKYFGQWDHLRIFGSDFSMILESRGFSVIAVDEAMFPETIGRKNVLFPPVLSPHPLATNYRNVFFCKKT